MAKQHPFKWRHFQAEIMVLCVRWYVWDALSYRDREEGMAERGHTAGPDNDLSVGPVLRP